MACFKWLVIMELNSVQDAVTQAYCAQLCCYSHCGSFEEGMHTSTYANTPAILHMHTEAVMNMQTHSMLQN